jgi:hypothetical protein
MKEFYVWCGSVRLAFGSGVLGRVMLLVVIGVLIKYRQCIFLYLTPWN